jgi:LmbE family N-acetylglucosaminyl deacetylase
LRGLSLGHRGGSALRILCLGAHGDDIEIGCGGSVLTLLAAHPSSVVRWVVFSGDAARASEARAQRADFLAAAGERDVRTLDFRESYFPARRLGHQGGVRGLRDFAPDLIFTHREADRHQDHRLIAELTWNTFRDHLILAYEIPKWDGDLASPQAFVPIAAEMCREKCRLLGKHFASQAGRHWFDEELFVGLLRGVECRSPSGYAEAFDARKWCSAEWTRSTLTRPAACAARRCATSRSTWACRRCARLASCPSSSTLPRSSSRCAYACARAAFWFSSWSR